MQLNKKSWRPARDITTNRLSSSPLQLAENTHLLLDETVLEAGQLTPLGIRNFEVRPPVSKQCCSFLLSFSGRVTSFSCLMLLSWAGELGEVSLYCHVHAGKAAISSGVLNYKLCRR